MAYLFDTALTGQGDFVGKAYFFRDDQYVRYDWATEQVDSGPTSLSAWNLPAPFRTGVDAALNGERQYKRKAYFFRGDQYVSYDWTKGEIGGPAPLSQWNIPLIESGVDTALNGRVVGDKTFFFKGNLYVLYDWATGQAIGPAPLSNWNLPGTFQKGVHAALNGERRYQGKSYLFRGPHYVSYDWDTTQVSGPAHLSLWKWPFAIGHGPAWQW